MTNISNPCLRRSCRNREPLLSIGTTTLPATSRNSTQMPKNIVNELLAPTFSQINSRSRGKKRAYPHHRINANAFPWHPTTQDHKDRVRLAKGIYPSIVVTTRPAINTFLMFICEDVILVLTPVFRTWNLGCGTSEREREGKLETLHPTVVLKDGSKFNFQKASHWLKMNSNAIDSN